MKFWINRGYLKEAVGLGGVISIQRADGAQSQGTNLAGAEDEAPSAATVGQEAKQIQDAEDLSKYLLVMVSNFSDGKSLSDIHNMLKMFYPPYDKSSDQLASILSALESKERIIFKGGCYSVMR